MIPRRAALSLSISISIALLSPAALQAQWVNLGVKAGATRSDVSNVENSSYQTAFVGGAYASLHTMQIIALQAEILYSQRQFATFNEGTNVQMDFVEIPLIVGLRIQGDPFYPVLYVGGSAAFETKCKLEGVATQGCESAGGSPTSPQWNFLAGAAIDWYVGPVVLTLDGRFNMGLNELQEGSDRKWRSFYLMAGIGYPLGRREARRSVRMSR